MRSLPEVCHQCGATIRVTEECWVRRGPFASKKRACEVSFKESVTLEILCVEHLPSGKEEDWLQSVRRSR